MVEAPCTKLGCHATCHMPSSPHLVQPQQPIGEREEERDTKVEHEEREREFVVGGRKLSHGRFVDPCPTETPIPD
jgi:hypothetical protein